MERRASDTPGVAWAAWLAWAALAALFILAIVLLARFADFSAKWLPYPYPRPGSEGLILYESLLVKHGGGIYAPITPEQFISGPYPPIYYWLAAAIMPASLPDFSSSQSVSSIFLPGRIVSLVSTILAALLLPVLVVMQGGYAARGRRALLGASAAGLLAGVLFVSLPQVIVWATRFRGDMLMIVLTAAGLTCVAVGCSSGRPLRLRAWIWLIAGAALFSLAFYTKQTALAGPIAAALYLLFIDWRSAVKWCAVLGTMVLVPFAILDIVTGNWFYLKMVTYHSLPLRALTLTRLLQFAFWEDQWPLILLALGQTLFVATERLILRFRQTRLTTCHGPDGLLVPLFVLAAVLTLPTGAVVGADHNHLLMPGVALSAAVGALLARLVVYLTERRPAAPATWAAGAVTAALVAIYILITSEPSSWYSPDLTLPGADQQEQVRKIVLNVSHNPGRLFFSDDPGLLALAGKQTPYDDPFTMAALATSGRWDETVLRKRLSHSDFALLMISCDVNVPSTCRSDVFTPGVLDAIRSGYRVLFRDVVFTYVPK